VLFVPGRPFSLRSLAFLYLRHGLQGGGGRANKEHIGTNVLSLPRPFQCMHFAKSVSANAPQMPKDTHTHDEQLPPVPICSTTSKQKPKIELRPGPVKPGTPTSSSSTARPADKVAEVVSQQQPRTLTQQQKIRPLTPPSLSTELRKEEVLQETEKAGLIEMTKKDVQDAAAHGILKLPPPDASWVGRLIHQAKELFVSFLAILCHTIFRR
jgi:hypothetical protein